MHAPFWQICLKMVIGGLLLIGMAGWGKQVLRAGHFEPVLPVHTGTNTCDRCPLPVRGLQDAVGKVRAGPHAKAQRRKGPGRRWCFPTETVRDRTR